MRPSVLLGGLLLASSLACLAPQRKAEFEADLKRWVGRPASEFILYKGDPTEVRISPGGGRICVFTLHTGQSAEGTARFANSDGTLGQGVRMRGAPLSCRLILAIDAQGTILSTRWEGNNCW